MYHILIVEDDEIIAKEIEAHLKSWSFEASCVRDFHKVMEEFIRVQPHLVLLDIRLPFFNGYHWCEEIRKLSRVPIIFLSSASDNMNIVMAMSMGGDDFICKPFDFEVLTAKIQAVLRRSYDFSGQTTLREHRGMILNMSDGSVFYQGKKIELSKNEAKILTVLLEHKGVIVGRSTLMNQLWQTDSFVDENTLSVNVNRLRRRLEAIGLEDFIETRKGQGYLIE